MQNAHRKEGQQKQQRKVKGKVKILIIALSVLILLGVIVGVKIYKLYHAPDNKGGIGDTKVTEDDSYDLSDEVNLVKASYEIINVGYGEAILFQYDQTEVLIDTGSEGSVENLISTLKSNVKGDLDYLILTSPRKERTGGAEVVYKNFKVGSTILGELDRDKKKISSLAKKNGSKVIDGKDMNIDLGNKCEISIFKPEVSSKKSSDRSLVTYITYDDSGFLALSDAGREEASRILPNLYSCDVLVVPNLGDPTDVAFTSDLYVRFLVASTDKQGNYPSDEHRGLNAYMLATYKSGNIRFTSNGSSVDTNIKMDEAAIE